MICRPTLVQTNEIGRVAEIVCGDSSTVVKAMDSGKVFGWGRGYSDERKLDISRFKPKELSSMEIYHRFLIPMLDEQCKTPVEQRRAMKPSLNMADKNKAYYSQESRESILSNLNIGLPGVNDGQE